LSRISEHNPAEASIMVSTSAAYLVAGRTRRIEARAEGTLKSTVDTFVVDIECTLLENDRIVRQRRWQDSVRRELV
jgi:hypothetical protein